MLNVTVTGASHKEIGKECQDYSLTWKNRSGSIKIAAVSDGHGGEEYYNSATGAHLACEIAVDVLKEFAGSIDTLSAAGQSKLITSLCGSIVTRWNDAVEKYGSDHPVKSFGCTLITYLQTPSYCIALQIGDGKFVALDSGDSWSQPIPWDDRCILNYTTSLCDEDALGDFRFSIGYTTPVAVFLSTDGIDGTFADGELLYNFFNRILNSVHSDGLENTCAALPKVLAHFSEVGSRDDMTLAAIINS